MKGRHLPGSQARAALTLAAAAAGVVLALSACGGASTTSSGSSGAGAEGEAVVAVTPSASWSPTMSPAPVPVVRPGQTLPSQAKLEEMFAYDTAEPMGFQSEPFDSQPGYTVDSIWYKTGGNDATGYLVMPEGGGPFPAVVWAPGWRTDVKMFLDDAAVMAQNGIAGLLLQEPYWVGFWSFDPREDTAVVAEYVRQERRALDLLETMPEIDAERIGFVGWSNGAHLCGGVLAGVDERVKAYAFIGMARPESNYRGLIPAKAFPKAAEWKRQLAQLALMDPVTYLRRNESSAFLFLNGKGDPNAMHDARAFLAAAPTPKKWHVYDGGHAPTPEAAKVLTSWLQANL